jgi:predicted transcriptional regulator
MRVLLSIKPEFADKIFSGEKTFEYRKASFAREVTTVVVYATQPVGLIIGEFDIDGVLVGAPADIWRETSSGAGISEDFFSEYFRGRPCGYAIKIINSRRYSKAINPYGKSVRFVPPQSFRYLQE